MVGRLTGITGGPRSSWRRWTLDFRNRRHRRLGDEALAALVARGDVAAFEALYDRHHPSLLAFCRHMTGSREDGEDALQQTFLRAHRALLAGRAPDAVRPWLFAIARNRCRTLLAARRPAVTGEEVEVAFDGLADDVRRRADLRELVADLGRLPEDQRGALVLHELGDLGHSEIATVIGCAPEKVKALVFQARTTLVADREARATPCEEIRGQLETAVGGLLRRAPLRRHLRQCAPCTSYRLVVAQQRAGLAIILPVAPSAGLKAAILGGAAATTAGGGAAAGGAVAGGGAATVTSGGGAAATTVGGGAAVTGGGGAAAAGGGGAIVAGAAAVKTLTAKVVVGAVVAGAGVTGAAVTVERARALAGPCGRAGRRPWLGSARPPTVVARGRSSPRRGGPRTGRRRRSGDRRRIATRRRPRADRVRRSRARAPSAGCGGPRTNRPPPAPDHEPCANRGPRSRQPPRAASCRAASPHRAPSGDRRRGRGDDARGGHQSDEPPPAPPGSLVGVAGHVDAGAGVDSGAHSRGRARAVSGRRGGAGARTRAVAGP